MSGSDHPTSPGLVARIRAYLSEEHGLTALLIILVAYSLVAPFLYAFAAGRLVTAAYFTLVAAAGMIAVGKRPLLNVSVRVVTVAVLVAAWYEVVYESRVTLFVSCILDALLIALVLVAVGLQVFQAGPVTAHRIRGAAVIYLLMGALFGIVYLLIVTAEPGAIRATADLDLADPQAVRSELNYFSFVTLTTVGYGDITPVSRAARSVATFEALSGQLFLAITLARLVSSQLAARDDRGA